MGETRASFTRSTGPLVSDPAKVAATEARNALLQFDEVRRLIGERSGDLRIASKDVCNLQEIAVRGIASDAGKFRKVPISISNTPHAPPSFELVPELVDEMCDCANSICTEAFHVSAYLMWRLNWIHPFADGNGRTSRAISYLALCCGLELELPGIVTVPDLIVDNKKPYYEALDSADAAFSEGKADVSQMEELIRNLLTQQLQSANL